jgi:hypothetical protein
MDATRTRIDGKFTRLGVYEPGETFTSTVLTDGQIMVSALFDTA